MMALESGMWRSWKLAAIAAAALAALSVPAITATPYHASLVVSTCVLLTLTLSMNLLVGTAGEFCLSHSAFYGIGAYTCALMSTQGGVPMGLAAFGSVGVAAMVALVIGYPLLRLTGYFLATASLAFSMLVEVLMRQSGPMLGGVNGIQGLPGVRLFGHEASGAAFLPIAVLTCVATVAALLNLRESPLGRAFVATKNSRVAAEAAGVHTDRVRLSAFTLSSSFAALAGWLQAAYQGHVDPHLFSLDLTFTWLFIIVIGGLGSIPGVVAATLLLGVVPQVFGVANVQQVLVLGVLILVAVLFAPQGLAGLARDCMLRWKVKAAR